MPVTQSRPPFTSRSGRGIVNVPNSCIESAEYIIQSISNVNLLPWKRGQSQSPNVIATFGDREINISETENFHRNTRGITSYKFDSLPNIGQGIICLNKTVEDLPYNMHLGAVVASSDESVLISNMMEPEGEVGMALINIIEINNAEEFLTNNFGDMSSKYIIGILRPQA